MIDVVHALGQPAAGVLALVVALALLLALPPAAAQGAQGTPDEPHEEVTFVPRPLGLGEATLETTVYRPAGEPPWPLAVINHGSIGYANPHQQDRYRPVVAARFFLDRGYLVVAPMRQGFSRSTGVYTWRCDHASYARRYGGDIAAVIEHFVQAGLARRDQVVVIGQSNGGMVALGYAASQPVARGVINFAGGINSARPDCNWQQGMVDAARELGAQSKVPSLWIYTETDTVFPPQVSKAFFEAYRDAGATARLELFASGGHAFSSSRQGRQAWTPVVQSFLQELGLPSAPAAQ